MSEHSELCPAFHQAVELIGRRWTGAIIFLLLKRPARFAELRSRIPGITDRMLSERLHELEGEGILVRTVIPETPVRVEYALTLKGQGLARVTDAIGAWAHEWAEVPADAREGPPGTDPCAGADGTEEVGSSSANGGGNGTDNARGSKQAARGQVATTRRIGV